MSDMPQSQPNEAKFLFYSGPNGRLHVEVIYVGDTVWLTQAKIAELFEVDRSVVTKHIGNIFKTGELDRDSVSAKFAHTASDGKIYNAQYYNLDVIISVGYRVSSLQATDFRKWATSVLHDYMIKGFVLDDERLKNGTHFGKDYFEELLERIREIRLSERRIYLKVTDLFALASDYDKSSAIVKEFFAFIQNKLHYAIAGKTAAEIIHGRANKTQQHMGLKTWKHAPDGKILRTDVTVAKNYLGKSELQQLQLTVGAFLDIAENRANRGIPTTMAQWLGIMDGYLDLNEYPILKGAGSVSKKQADVKALNEYTDFRMRQDNEYVSDFEKDIKRLEQQKGTPHE